MFFLLPKIGLIELHPGDKIKDPNKFGYQWVQKGILDTALTDSLISNMAKESLNKYDQNNFLGV